MLWVLDTTDTFFHADAHSMAFTGGTSLSKVYDIINRFSEDVNIDITHENLAFNNDLMVENLILLRNT